MMTYKKLQELKKNGIKGLAILELLLLLEEPIYLSDLVEIMGKHRRTIENLKKNHPDLIECYYHKENGPYNNGRPCTIIYHRSEKAERLLSKMKHD